VSSKLRFEKLFEPGRIGTMKIKNRIVMPCMSTGFGSGGYVTERTKHYYEERARGGVGLIVVETNAVEPRGQLYEGSLRIDDDKFIPALQQVVEGIHKHGAKAVQQISHAGRQAKSSLIGCQPVAPSAIPRLGYEIPHELSLPEIVEIIDCFALAANRAKKAGFDGVELHGHGGLINQFLMPSSNQRSDKYGGDLKNRARFLMEIIEAIRKAVGQEYPLWFRIMGEEGDFMGNTPLDELLELARMLEGSGVDAISVSGMPYTRPYFSPTGYFVHSAAAIKSVVTIPVIVAGKITPRMGERILKQGQADFIAMGRQIIADPQLPNKLARGKLEDIVPCIRCMECLNSMQIKEEPMYCTVNASAGRECEYQIKPSEKKKKVLVVGSGPAGMEAARVAALRGHEVVLCDKEHKLGGSLGIAAIVRIPDVEDSVAALARYFKTQVRKLGIKVRLGKEVDEALVREIGPDVVILATGGTVNTPEIPGINSRVVVRQSRLHRMTKLCLIVFTPKLLTWLTHFYLPVGKRVVIVGGGIQGLELAEFLVKRGRKVTVTETSDELGVGLPELTQIPLLETLTEQGCTLLSGVKYEKITDKGLNLVTKEGEKQTIEADTILPALPLLPNTGLFESLKGKIPEIYLAGDCKEPHTIMEAIGDGYSTALNI